MSRSRSVHKLNPYAQTLEKDQFLQQMDNLSRKLRFGLFSLPGPLGLGDDSKKYIPNCLKQQDGSILTGPKNFLVGDRRKKYFSKPGYTTIGDEYLELDKIERFGKMLKNLSIPHNQVFKSTTNKQLKNRWPYMEDPIRVVPVNKDRNGKVRIKKRNFLTKVGWRTSKYDYMSDPYNRQEHMRRQERIEHKRKILHPFRTTKTYTSTFSSNWKVYNNPDMPAKRRKKSPADIHKNRWKKTNPSKKGYQKTFQNVRYIPEMDEDDLKVKYIFEKQRHRPWKPAHETKSKAQKSIMVNTRKSRR